MKVIHLGVGDAFNFVPNNSHLILSKTKLLLDCGYSAVQQLFKNFGDPEFLDAVYISYCHADHYFGLAPLITRFKDDEREKKFTILCMKGNKEKIMKLLDLGYKGVHEKLTYDLEFVEVKEGDVLLFKEFKMSFAHSVHAEPNLAIRVEVDGKVICYSGDGKYTDRTEKLYQNADLLIHEAYTLDKEKEGHTNIKQVLEMAKRNNVKKVALTHISRKEVFDKAKDIKKVCEESGVNFIIPQAGDASEV